MPDDTVKNEDDEVAKSQTRPVLTRAEGVTIAEQYLNQLCHKSFLSLWSYPSIFRDQGKTGNLGDGKEICDHLVVFENHIIIFSDKAIDFPDSGNLQLDWSRWFRRAVMDSAKQIWGAERWLKEHPDRIFLDRACTQLFPYDLPDPTKAHFHRVVVAHNSAERCKRELGGSGSLMIDSKCIGEMHWKSKSEGGCGSFTIGNIDPSRGFVHILDDTTLDIVLSTQDTVSDFISYLTRKEKFLCSDTQILAAGEEDLLAYYMGKLDADGIHDFVVPAGNHLIYIEEGHWEEFLDSPERKSQTQADKISYMWDELIEVFNKHLFAGTQYYVTDLSVKEQEPGLRFLAREPRTRRRFLAGALISMIKTTPPSMRRLQVILPSHPGDPYFILLLLPHLENVPYEQYREVRRKFLGACCSVVKFKFPKALDIVGIATETARNESGSEDLVVLDARIWTKEQQNQAESLHKDLGILKDPKGFRETIYEYPTKPSPRTSFSASSFMSPSSPPRRQPCPCGSGKRYKNCCEKNSKRK